MKTRVGALAAGALVLLALAVTAVGATLNEHKFSMSFSKKTPATSTGIKFSTDRYTYKAPASDEKANPVTKIVFTLAPGTRTDPSVVPLCKQSALEESGATACPKGSKVGTGKAVVITGVDIFDPVEEDVAIFATRGGLLAHLTGLQSAVIPLTLKGNKLTAVVPRVCLPGGTPADDCSKGEAVLTELTATLAARSKGRKALVRTPPTCPSTRKWVSKAAYQFRSGDKETKTSVTTCKR